MKLASGFCIPEQLPVHTGIKGHQVHPLIRFYAEEPRTSPWQSAIQDFTTLWHADADKRACDRQMSCKRLQPSHLPSSNLLTLVNAGTTEYIAAGDSQAVVPFPTEIRRDFDLSERRIQVFPICCPEKGATEATSCPKGGNMWRH